MVLTYPGADGTASNDTVLRVASHSLTAEGMAYERDGINYIVVDEVVSDMDITNVNHDDWGVVPGFAIPEPKE
jgi:hypothetical protein